jgi:hypothetical protein
MPSQGAAHGRCSGPGLSGSLGAASSVGEGCGETKGKRPTKAVFASRVFDVLLPKLDVADAWRRSQAWHRWSLLLLARHTRPPEILQKALSIAWSDQEISKEEPWLA